MKRTIWLIALCMFVSFMVSAFVVQHPPKGHLDWFGAACAIWATIGMAYNATRPDKPTP